MREGTEAVRIIRETGSDMGPGSPCQAIILRQDCKKVGVENQIDAASSGASRAAKLGLINLD
jgi:hypothetical protein